MFPNKAIFGSMFCLDDARIGLIIKCTNFVEAVHLTEILALNGSQISFLPGTQ